MLVKFSTIFGVLLGAEAILGQFAGSLHAFVPHTGPDAHGNQHSGLDSADHGIIQHSNPLDIHTEHLLPGNDGVLLGHSSIPRTGGDTNPDSMFGEPLGLATIHKTSDNLDKPKTLTGLDYMTRLTADYSGFGRENPVTTQLGTVKNGHTVADTPISGHDYMSRLAAGYSRLRTSDPFSNMAAAKDPRVTNKKASIPNVNVNVGPVHGDVFGEPLGPVKTVHTDTHHDHPSVPIHGNHGKPKKFNSHWDQPGQHGNFLDIAVEHIETGQTHLHTHTNTGHPSETLPINGGGKINIHHGHNEPDHISTKILESPDHFHVDIGKPTISKPSLKHLPKKATVEIPNPVPEPPVLLTPFDIPSNGIENDIAISEPKVVAANKNVESSVLFKNTGINEPDTLSLPVREIAQGNVGRSKIRFSPRGRSRFMQRGIGRRLNRRMNRFQRNRSVGRRNMRVRPNRRNNRNRGRRLRGLLRGLAG